ncbi:MAG: tRNA pseudouridine(55) synthase TruB [Thermoleophilia bacterium]|nr:tRNA pseudouridine(55) synthase TruB [Thermoleophilia bacterium]MDH3725173.1 tRNA pseudouridine(55) synthase TruB [Thermoleophilia bacterium]
MTESHAPRIWLVDKPQGPTSHDIVAQVRRAVGRRVKVGHAGTLDPFATGLLIVLVGRATRLARYLADLDKTYVAEIVLGRCSESGDPEGPITEGAAPPQADEVDRAIQELEGVHDQLVPALSAVKVDGERLYARVRRGEAVPERPSREISITAARRIALSDDRRRLTVELGCSKGTYIRQVAVDLGERLGCGGYCDTLRRTAIGSLSVGDAVPPDAVGPHGGLPPHVALAHMTRRELNAEEARRVSHGEPLEGDDQGTVALTHGERLVAVARGDGSRLQPEVVLG